MRARGINQSQSAVISALGVGEGESGVSGQWSVAGHGFAIKQQTVADETGARERGKVSRL